MRQKQILKNLKEALKQDYLYTSEELSFMREQLDVLEKANTQAKINTANDFILNSEYAEFATNESNIIYMKKIICRFFF